MASKKELREIYRNSTLKMKCDHCIYQTKYNDKAFTGKISCLYGLTKTVLNEIESYILIDKNGIPIAVSHDPNALIYSLATQYNYMNYDSNDLDVDFINGEITIDNAKEKLILGRIIKLHHIAEHKKSQCPFKAGDILLFEDNNEYTA